MIQNSDAKWTYHQPILKKKLTIASGATPIGSAGRAPDEDEKYRLRMEEGNYRLCIGANYRLHF
jgi:hypothetical protein